MLKHERMRSRRKIFQRKVYDRRNHDGSDDNNDGVNRKTIDLTDLICYFLFGCWLFYRLLRCYFHGVVVIGKDGRRISHLYKGSDWWKDPDILQSTISLSSSFLPPAISAASFSGRTFLSYTPSIWETKWMTSIDEWVQRGTVCNQLSFDTELLRTFWNTTCTSLALDQNLHRNHKGWCILDDTHQPLFFHIPSGKVSGSRPGPLDGVSFGPPQPVVVNVDITSNLSNSLSKSPSSSLPNMNALVFSKFTYRLDTTGHIVHDYIEPLIGRLRHPLDCCEYAYKLGVNLKRSPPNCLMTQRLGISRTQYIPQYRIDGFEKAHFFDSSSYHWKRAKSTLSYVAQVWKRYGIEFDFYHIYEGKVPNETFMEHVPVTERSKIDYRQRERKKKTTKTTIYQTDFVQEIVTKTSPHDYVLFHLNLEEDPNHELRILQEILDNRRNVLDYIDELLYTIPLPLNATDRDISYQPWYTRFLQLRQRGIRAHAFTKE
jgi:hypothetical protein